VLVVVLGVVLERDVVPDAEKDPFTVVFPETRVPAVERFPAVTCPEIPAPPATIKAPVEVVILGVVLFKEVAPEAENVPATLVLPEESEPVSVLFDVTCPAIPIPPATVNAPDVVLKLADVLDRIVTPLADSVPVIIVLLAERLPRVVAPA